MKLGASGGGGGDAKGLLIEPLEYKGGGGGGGGLEVIFELSAANGQQKEEAVDEATIAGGEGRGVENELLTMEGGDVLEKEGGEGG